MAQNRLEEALVELDTSIQLAPNDPFIHYLRATVAFHSGRDVDAIRTLDAVREWAPAYVLVPALVSKIRLWRGEIDEAADALGEFERVAGDTSLGLTLRAVFDARTGRESEARAE